MNVLIVYHAGAMQAARRIYEALAKAGDLELTVAVPQQLKIDRVYDPSGLLSVDREEHRGGYRLIPIPLRDPNDYWQGFESERLRSLIRQVQPDIIHVLDEPTSGYLFQIVWQRLRAWRRSRVLFYGFGNLPIRLSRLGRLKWKLTWSQMAGGVAANSETLQNLKRAGFPPDRLLERIFWGIPMDVFRPMEKLALKKRLGLECEQIVGFVGRLVPEKGLTVLLAAMRNLPATVHCLIIGGGPMRAELELWSGVPDLRGRIHLFGVMQPETLADYLNCMDVLALPSMTMPHWKEQYGRVIGEAMACGIPVVGSDSGAVPEVIGPDGLIVPEGDASALAAAVQTGIFDKDIRDRLKQQGLERAERELSVRAMSERLLGFYKRVLGAQ